MLGAIRNHISETIRLFSYKIMINRGAVFLRNESHWFRKDVKVYLLNIPVIESTEDPTLLNYKFFSKEQKKQETIMRIFTETCNMPM